MKILSSIIKVKINTFLGFILLFVFSCSKDLDTLREAIEPENENLIEEQSTTNNNETASEENSQEDKEDRVTIFPASNDAFIQDGVGINQDINRLEENYRSSYLKFDLSPIDSIEAKIKSAVLEFIVYQDDGNGIIQLFKGDNNNWSENSLSESSKPGIASFLGSVQQEFEIGQSIKIILDIEKLTPRENTLILKHKNGDDLAFASKENKYKYGPKLIVTYESPLTAKAIVVEEIQVLEEEPVTEETSEEETTTSGEAGTEDSPEEENSEEENTAEENTTEEEAATEEENAEGETTAEEDTTEEEETTEEALNEAPAAKATASPLNGLVPLEVSFYGDESSDDNGIVNHAWDFKDGSTASEVNPTHTFESPGTYNVELIVKDEQGLTHNDTVTITVEESDNEAPIAKATASPLNGLVPLEVSFYGDESSDDNGIVNHAWDFKDGSTASVVNPTHTFESPGTYNVELIVKDEQGLAHKDTVTIIVEEADNEAPIAKATASPLNGVLPLEVSFYGDESSDDIGIVSHAWDFKDGATASAVNPKHTFEAPGTYNVELIVKDEQGLSHNDTIIITVTEDDNEPPIAIASSNVTGGTAPLQVIFAGHNSYDNQSTVSHNWNFDDGTTISNSNPTHTFDTPGVYNVVFTVYDTAGLSDSKTITITVIPENTSQISCDTGANMANQSGDKIWCWNDITIPDYSDKTGVPFSNGTLNINSECYEKQVTNAGNRLKFKVSPRNPGVESWCTRDYNMRAEISTAPWYVKNPIGTEEWYGWTYTLGDDYIIDQKHPWLFYQVHHGVRGDSPQMELLVAKDGLYGANAGEIVVLNNANYNEKVRTGIVPQAGQTLNIVVHTIWGNDSNGVLQVWIDGNIVYDKQVRTVYTHAPWGGNSKWGIYKWPWRETGGVVDSENQGITSLEAYIGTLRGITRKPGDAGYGSNSYSKVAPN